MCFTVIILALFLAFTTACTLTSVQPGSQDLTPILVVPSPTSRFVLPTNTPSISPTATQTTGGGTTTCVPRTDWIALYTVVAGDTLGSIADRVNSTSSTLAIGNCLANADSIFEGQILRLPQAPSVPTATQNPAADGPSQQGTIYISAIVSADAGNFFLLRGETVTLRWDDAPGSLYQVTFVLMGASGQNEIGQDTNPSDGISINWTVLPALAGHQIIAYGRYFENAKVVNSYPIYISSAPPSGQGCEIAPADPNGATAYTQADLNSPAFGTITVEYVEVLGRALNGWYGFDPGIAQAGNTGASRLRWLPLDTRLLYRGNCPDRPAGTGGTQNYSNPKIGIALDYPLDWTLLYDENNNITFKGPDGSIFEIIYGVSGQVTPVTQAVVDCKNAFACLGNRTVQGESSLSLPNGITGTKLAFSADQVDGNPGPSAQFFTIIANRNFYMRGFGNLAYFDQIIATLRVVVG
jgi:LysM repeat protein